MLVIKGQRDLAAKRRRLTNPQKWIIVLGLLMLILGLGNLARAVVALRYNAQPLDLPPTVPLTYLAAMGGFWGLVFILGTAGLVRFRPWGRWLVLAAVTLFEAHVWINHLLLDASDSALQTRPWDLLLTLLLLALVWSSLNLRNVRKVFSQGSSRNKPKERKAK
jgi:hypothetical protein